MQKYLLFIYILLPCSVLAWRHSLLQAKSLYSCSTGGELSPCVDNYRHNNLFLGLCNTIFSFPVWSQPKDFTFSEFFVECPMEKSGNPPCASEKCLCSSSSAGWGSAEHRYLGRACAPAEKSFCTAPVFILINTHTLSRPVLQSWIISSALQASFKQAFPPFACSFKSTKHYLHLCKSQSL